MRFAAGPCSCAEIKAEQDAATEAFNRAYAHYLLQTTAEEKAKRSRIEERGGFTQLVEEPAKPFVMMRKLGALTEMVDNDEGDKILRRMLAHLFEDDPRVDWEYDEEGNHVKKDGFKVLKEATICQSCLMVMLFEVYAAKIFPAIMPSTPSFLSVQGKVIDHSSEEGKGLIEEYKKTAFGFQLLFVSLFGWRNVSTYLHIIGVHSAEFIYRWGSVGLYSQGAFEAAHKLFRSQVHHTTQDGGYMSRCKLTRDLVSLSELQSDLREPTTEHRGALHQALVRYLRHQVLGARRDVENIRDNNRMSKQQLGALEVLRMRFQEFDNLIPDHVAIVRRAVNQFQQSVTPEQLQCAEARFQEALVSTQKRRSAKRKLPFN